MGQRMNESRTSYPGGKAGAGVVQQIINQMPPHERYIEAFAGGAAVLRAKQPAALANIAMDADGDVISGIRADAAVMAMPDVRVFQADAIEFLRDAVAMDAFGPDTLIYLDPPYLMSTRRAQRQIYRCELSDDQHGELLRVIVGLGCMVMISGYYSEMYATALRGWRHISFWTTTRGGTMAEEFVWMNFAEPLELHDYRFLGANFRERQDIKRKRERWVRRLREMSSVERFAMMNALETLRGSRIGETAERGRDHSSALSPLLDARQGCR